MNKNNIVNPVLWPYKLSISKFHGNFPIELCKEIYEFLSIENNRYGFMEHVIGSKPKINIEKIFRDKRIRDVNIFLSFFGLKDKLYNDEICDKYNLSKERVRQITSVITRKLLRYSMNFTDKRFTVAPRHMPYLKKYTSESIGESPSTE